MFSWNQCWIFPEMLQLRYCTHTELCLLRGRSSALLMELLNVCASDHSHMRWPSRCSQDRGQVHPFSQRGMWSPRERHWLAWDTLVESRVGWELGPWAPVPAALELSHASGESFAAWAPSFPRATFYIRVAFSTWLSFESTRWWTGWLVKMYI